jgi:hypothetical protein
MTTHDFRPDRPCRPAGWQGEGIVAVVLLLASIVPSPGCGDSDELMGKRVRVFGAVTLDGKPLPAGAILFHSGEGEHQVSAVGYIEDGQFDIPEQDGPLAGTARVEFRPKPLPQDQFERALEQSARTRKPLQLDVAPIPSRYGAESKLTVDILPDTGNELDFPLTSRP